MKDFYRKNTLSWNFCTCWLGTLHKSLNCFADHIFLHRKTRGTFQSKYLTSITKITEVRARIIYNSRPLLDCTWTMYFCSGQIVLSIIDHWDIRSSSFVIFLYNDYSYRIAPPGVWFIRPLLHTLRALDTVLNCK